MEKAKAAVGNFLSKDGKHDTTMHEVKSALFPESTQKSNEFARRQPSSLAREGDTYSTREWDNGR